LVALVSAVIGVYWQMGNLRADMLDRFLVVEQRLGEQDASIERRFGEVNERLVRIEAMIERLDPDYAQPAD